MSVVMGSWSQVQAQNCDELLEPFFQLNNIDTSIYPAGKAEWRCCFARSAFYYTNSIPDNAPVYNITEVTNKLTGKNIERNFVVNIDHMSYYAYNFDHFQAINDKKTVYFRLANGKHKYLAVRSIIDMYESTCQMVDDLQKERSKNK